MRMYQKVRAFCEMQLAKHGMLPKCQKWPIPKRCKAMIIIFLWLLTLENMYSVHVLKSIMLKTCVQIKNKTNCKIKYARYVLDHDLQNENCGS